MKPESQISDFVEASKAAYRKLTPTDRNILDKYDQYCGDLIDAIYDRGETPSDADFDRIHEEGYSKFPGSKYAEEKWDIFRAEALRVQKAKYN